jgi:hypothetical protein
LTTDNGQWVWIPTFALCALCGTVFGQEAEKAWAEDDPPKLTEISWSVGDTTVEAIVTFDRVPARFSGYALEGPDRIVLDCFSTDLTATIAEESLPDPVTNAELGELTMDPDVEFVRLALFTSRAVDYRLVETPTRLRLILFWNTRLERQVARSKRRRKATLISVLSGAGAAAAIVAGVFTYRKKHEEPSVEDEIPPPSIPTPDGQ